MKINEIIDDRTDPDIAVEDVRRDIEASLAREPRPFTDAEIAMMYGDPDEELRLEKLRLDNLKARAEIVKTLAAAARDRAEAAQKIASSTRSG